MEKALNFISKFGYSNFKIKDATGKQIAYVIASSNEEAQEEFKKEYEDLETGKQYRVIVGKNANFQESRSEHLDFKKGATTVKNTMDADFLDKIKREAYEQGVKDAEIKMLRKEIADLREDHNKLIAALKVKFDELDGKEDGDFTGKVEEAANVFSTVQNLFSGSGMNID
jgi:predicted RNase H-like nuclease (RuvC/YqgF family)